MVWGSEPARDPGEVEDMTAIRYLAHKCGGSAINLSCPGCVEDHLIDQLAEERSRTASAMAMADKWRAKCEELVATLSKMTPEKTK
jgi:hypothetical protein